MLTCLKGVCSMKNGSAAFALVLSAALTAGLAVILTASPAYAATCQWTGAVDSDWATVGNWSSCLGAGSNEPPGSLDTATIPSVANLPTIATTTSATVSGLTINTGSTVTVYGTLALGNLGSGGNLDVNGTLNWTSGTMSGSGSTNIAGGAALHIIGSGVKTLSGRTLHNAATTMWTGTGNLLIRDGGIFKNSGTFDAPSGQTISTVLGGTFNNNGTFTKSAGTSTMQVNVVFNNNGLLGVQTGTLRFTGGFTQTGGTTTLYSANLESTSAVDIQDGALTGSGTVIAHVTSGGEVRPGGSTGVLTIAGDYTQSANGILTLEIGGSATGTERDLLDITGNALLAGTLNVSLVGGFIPEVGDTFVIVTYGDISGAFDSVNLPGRIEGQTPYGTSTVSLDITAVLPPPAIQVPILGDWGLLFLGFAIAFGLIKLRDSTRTKSAHA